MEHPDLDVMDSAVARFCSDVVTEPLCFFSEADLQGMLYSRLAAAFPDAVTTSVSRGPGSKGKYRTGRVHREYGAGAGRRTDISVFDPLDLARVDSPGLKVGGKYMRPLFAVELGTEKTIDTAAHLANDAAKLAAAKARGYLIHFYRDITKADAGTASRTRTEDKLERLFRGPVEAAAFEHNVVNLCFVLRLARRTKTIRGKCELLVTETGEWKRVNLQRVEDMVLQTLARRPASI